MHINIRMKTLQMIIKGFRNYKKKETEDILASEHLQASQIQRRNTQQVLSHHDDFVNDYDSPRKAIRKTLI